MLDVLVWLGVLAGIILADLPESSPPIQQRPVNLAWYALLGIVALIGLNQFAFVVYVYGAHGGDPSFIAQYLPSDWFQLPTGPWWSALKTGPWGLLEWSVLRVQSVLEVPFTMAAYLSAAWFVDPRLPYRLSGWPGRIAVLLQTVTWCAIEIELRNPYTDDDLMGRVFGGVFSLLILQVFRRGGATTLGWSVDLVSLGLRLSAIASIALLTVITAWVALCYNPGLIGAFGPIALGAILWVMRQNPRLGVSKSAFLDLATDAAKTFCILFLPAAIPIHEQFDYDSAGWTGLSAVLFGVVWLLRARFRQIVVPTLGAMG